MLSFLWLAGVYGAYRIIRAGLERPQSERLSGYGCVVPLALAAALAARLF